MFKWKGSKGWEREEDKEKQNGRKKNRNKALVNGEGNRVEGSRG